MITQTGRDNEWINCLLNYQGKTVRITTKEGRIFEGTLVVANFYNPSAIITKPDGTQVVVHSISSIEVKKYESSKFEEDDK